MESSVPTSSGGGVPAALSAMKTALAPARCAFFTLTMKAHSPRSITATLPCTAALFLASSGAHAKPRPSA